ncbi:MAG: AMP-binding protein [Devosia sp.]|nr:AMP-binding protein [Devosia sp.]
MTERSPLRNLHDIAALEQTPLDARLQAQDLIGMLTRSMTQHARRDAFVNLRHGSLTEQADVLRYDEVLARVRQFGRLLREMGVGREDVVALLLPNVVQAFWAPLGACLAGIAFPLNWMLRPEALTQLLQASGAKVLVALGPSADFRIWENVCDVRKDLPGLKVLRVSAPDAGEAGPDELDALCAGQPAAEPAAAQPASPGDTAFLIATGGTTGNPKIAPLTHHAVMYKTWASAELLDMQPGQRAFAVHPQFHVGGLLNSTLAALYSGVTSIIPGPLGLRNKTLINDYWKWVERHGITELAGVPTSLGALTQVPVNADISSLRPFALTGSAGLAPAIGRHFENVAGVRVLSSYGMTENTGSACMPPRDGDPRYGASGIRYPYTQVRTAQIGADGHIERWCAIGETGEILVRGPGLIGGYLDPSFDHGLFADGWLCTGDLGSFDADGYISVTGRRKDLIIRSGHNIDPRIIEEALAAHPAVHSVAAVGKPDAYAGEVPVAYVQLKPDAVVSDEALIGFARERIAERAATPAEITQIDAMPLTAVGKIFRPELRRQAAARAFSQLALSVAGPQRRPEARLVEREGAAPAVQIEIDALDEASDRAVHSRLSEALGRFTWPSSIVWRPIRSARPLHPPHL